MEEGRFRRLTPVPGSRYRFWFLLAASLLILAFGVLWALWWLWSLIGGGPSVPNWVQLGMVFVSIAVWLWMPRLIHLDEGRGTGRGIWFIVLAWGFGALVGTALLMISIGLGLKGAISPNLEWVRAGLTLLIAASMVFRTV